MKTSRKFDVLEYEGYDYVEIEDYLRIIIPGYEELRAITEKELKKKLKGDDVVDDDDIIRVILFEFHRLDQDDDKDHITNEIKANCRAYLKALCKANPSADLKPFYLGVSLVKLNFLSLFCRNLGAFWE